MTGFGMGSVAFAGGSIVAEVRSVNQRFLDVRVKLPREMADLGLFVEQLVRERVRRGRVELVVEGEVPELKAFQQAIREEGLASLIRNEQIEWSDAQGGLRGFEIAR